MTALNEKRHGTLRVWTAAKGSAPKVAVGLAMVIITIGAGGWAYENWAGIVGALAAAFSACIRVATFGGKSFWTAACGGLIAIAVCIWGICINYRAGEYVSGWLKAGAALLFVSLWLVCAVGATQMSAPSFSSAYQVIAVIALWSPVLVFSLFLMGLLLEQAIHDRRG